MLRSPKTANLFAAFRVSAIGVALCFPSTGGIAQAADFCAQIDELADQSERRFTAILKQASDKAGDHEVTLKLAEADDCRVTLRSRQSWYQCSWDFAYRAPAAYERFEAYAGKMEACLGERARPYEDQSVNHPDFYALRGFDLSQAEVSVSVKDKGALSKTFVFIRVRGKRQE